MSGEVDARPPAGELDAKPPLRSVQGHDGEDVIMKAEDAGDETEEEDHSERREAVEPSSHSVSGVTAPATVIHGAPIAQSHRGLEAESKPSNGWRTPPASVSQQIPPASGPSEEAAALLLNFSAVVEPTLPPSAERPAGATFPHTPPHDSPNITAPSAPSVTSHTPSSPSQLPTPSAPSPEASTKPAKPKRKRNAVAGPSRRSSLEDSNAEGRPPHWMGADNSVIRCICSFTEDDGFTVQCEHCNAWEHALCFGYRDESSLPDVFICELCNPRPLAFSIEQARNLQLQARARYGIRPAQEIVEKKRPKAKRPRTADNVKEKDRDREKEKENVDPGEENRDPANMGPPSIKPKRRSAPGKPRSRAEAASLREGQEDEDYFRILPWELEYTPLKDSIIRGRAGRQVMTQLYKEWIDGEEEQPRKARPTYHESGLPSPTETGLRLSPDNMLSPPDFSILAPPVPPVFLSGKSLSALEAPTAIRPIEESTSACYLPLKYMEPSAGIYPRPTLYGVFATEQLSVGSFVGEFKSEIMDAASYRLDPINQYSALGVPKPYVRSVGPPVNLILDARSYGCEMRFVRSGCHPNAVIRPIFFRSEGDSNPKLLFGVFAAREISKNDEVVLGWEWDDQHVVHTLRAVIDSTLRNAVNKPGIPTATMELLAGKFDSILTNIFGTFQSCACTVTTDCAFAQMRRLVNGQTFHGISGQRARKRIDLGELLGAVRGWRRRELEEAAAAKARQYRSSGEWEVWRTAPSALEIDREGLSRAQSERSAGDPEPILDDDEDNVEPMDEDKVEPEEPEGDLEGEPELDLDIDDDLELVPTRAVEESLASTLVEPPQAAEANPNETDDEATATLPAPAAVPDSMDVDPPMASEQPKAESVVAGSTNEGDVTMAEEHPVTPKNAPQELAPSSSVLSSIPQDDQAHINGDDSGHESDATTITIARSNFSGSEPESEGEAIENPVRPVAVRRGRRVLSPSGDSSERESSVPSEAPEPPKPIRRAPPKAKAVVTSTPPRPSNKRRARKNVIASSDEDLSSDDDEPVPSTKRKARPAPKLKGKAVKKRKAEISDESESEKENVKARKDRRKSDLPAERSDKTATIKSAKSDKAGKAVKSKPEKMKKENADQAKPEKKPRKVQVEPEEEDVEPEKEKVDEEVEGKIAKKDKKVKKDAENTGENVEKVDPSTEPAESSTSIDQADVPEGKNEDVEMKQEMPGSVDEPSSTTEPLERVREPSPEKVAVDKGGDSEPVKDSTSDESTAKEKTPEPAVKEPPPKKVSMREYLATHKIRKHTSAPEAPADATPTVPAVAVTPITTTEEVKKPEESEPVAPLKAEPESPAVSAANAARLNLNDFLPSSRAPSTPLGTPFSPATPRPITSSTPSSAYVPRTSDHLPTPSSSYAPRPSPSYVPRALGEEQSAPHQSPSFVNRQSDQDYFGPSPTMPRASLPPAQTPPRPTMSLPDMPPALGSRDGPPHQGYGPRAPPTGPRIPPTGPRGSWQGPSPSHSSGGHANPNGPVSPVQGFRSRGGFMRGGFNDRGGGWRGRGYRGRGRGMGM